MKSTITATYLAKHLSDVLNRVRYRGEEFIVERNGERIARLGPASAPLGITWKEFVAQLADMPKPDDRFADDLEEIRAEMAKVPLELPEWPS